MEVLREGGKCWFVEYRPRIKAYVPVGTTVTAILTLQDAVGAPAVKAERLECDGTFGMCREMLYATEEAAQKRCDELNEAIKIEYDPEVMALGSMEDGGWFRFVHNPTRAPCIKPSKYNQRKMDWIFLDSGGGGYIGDSHPVDDNTLVRRVKNPWEENDDNNACGNDSKAV